MTQELKMNIEMLREEFKTILKCEEKARTFYDHYVNEVDDAYIKDRLTAIRSDEEIHIKLVNKLIEIIS